MWIWRLVFIDFVVPYCIQPRTAAWNTIVSSVQCSVGSAKYGPCSCVKVIPVACFSEPQSFIVVRNFWQTPLTALWGSHLVFAYSFFFSLNCPPPKRPTWGDVILARTEILPGFSERTPPPPDSRSPSLLGRSLNPSLSAAAAASVKSRSKEKMGMTQDCRTVVHCTGQTLANLFYFSETDLLFCNHNQPHERQRSYKQQRSCFST